MPADFRIERDSMGELKVPASALWGAQTQRAVNNFPISGLRMPPSFIRARSSWMSWTAETASESGPSAKARPCFVPMTYPPFARGRTNVAKS